MCLPQAPPVPEKSLFRRCSPQGSRARGRVPQPDVPVLNADILASQNRRAARSQADTDLFRAYILNGKQQR